MKQRIWDRQTPRCPSYPSPVATDSTASPGKYHHSSDHQQALADYPSIKRHNLFDKQGGHLAGSFPNDASPFLVPDERFARNPMPGGGASNFPSRKDVRRISLAGLPSARMWIPPLHLLAPYPTLYRYRRGLNHSRQSSPSLLAASPPRRYTFWCRRGCMMTIVVDALTRIFRSLWVE